ncbi:hypothetical protein EDD85DRAFT_961258 [Armillaria nabsnona]|nr:hypothetical protein EDD85DRAFT_961258 [Armillaria nabsnona]
MFANNFKPALQRKPTPQYTPPPKYTSTPQSNPATPYMYVTKSQKYIRISKGDKYYIFKKSQVPTYQWLIYNIRKYIPGMYRKVHNRLEPIPIVITTYVLPSCQGNGITIPPSWWTTVITDIDNIHILS